MRFHRRSVSSCHSDSSLPGPRPARFGPFSGPEHQSISPGPTGLVAALLETPQAAALVAGRGGHGAPGPPRPGQADQVEQRLLLGRGRRRRVLVEEPGLGLRDVPLGRGRGRRTRCRRPSGRVISITSPGLTSRCGLADWPLTSTLPPLHAFCASDRVLNRHATSSQTSRRRGTDLFSTETSVRGTGLPWRDLSPWRLFLWKTDLTPYNPPMTRRLSMIVLLVLRRRRAGRARGAAAHHVAQPAVRPQLRRRLLPRQLPADRRLLEEARDASPIASTVRSIGKTAEGRDQLMAIVTSPANHKNLARYKDISRRLALADGLTDDAGARARARRQGRRLDRRRPARDRDARRAAARRDGLSDGQPHRRRDDADPRRRRSSCSCTRIRTATISSPTGTCATPIRSSARSTACRELYQKYIGHDNNRDFFASTQAGDREHESRALPRVVPADSLQPPSERSGRHGPVLAAAARSVQLQRGPAASCSASSRSATRLHTRLAAEGKPGATMRSGGPYDGWWNGGIRNTAAFHNTIAILTEMIGSPTPMRIPLVMDRQLPTSDIAYPVAAAGMALPPVDRLLGLVQPRDSRHRVADERELPLQPLRDGQALDRARQHGHVDAAPASVRGGSGAAGRIRAFDRLRAGGRGAPGGRGGRGGGGNDDALWAALHKPADRDPRAFMIPSSQPDFPTATRFVNALLETGITVQRATREFSAQGKTYPAGSFVVLTAQAFRPHVMDMFEPQDHPDNFPCRAARRRGRTTTPAGRSRFRWASSSIGFSTRSPDRSRSSPTGTSRRPPAACRPRRPAPTPRASSSSTRSSPRTGCSPRASRVSRQPDGVRRRRRRRRQRRSSRKPRPSAA